MKMKTTNTTDTMKPMKSMKRPSDRACLLLAGGITVVALIAACGGPSRSRAEIRLLVADSPGSVGPGGPQAGAVMKLDPATAGTISGTVRWEGTKPMPEALDVSGTPQCTMVHKETIYKENLVVNDNGTVCFALVSIDSTDVYAPPEEPFVLDQVGCRYVPHVVAVMAGQKIKIKSSDSTLHNVHFIPTGEINQEENIAMPVPGIRERIFTAADWIKFKCEVHPWMGAWVAIRTHPFFAVTGKEGTYSIPNVPAGTHKLVLKHEMLGEQAVTVTVEAGKVVTQDFKLHQ